jgi:hypothetical protein
MDYINTDKENHSLISIDRKEKEDLTISMKEACRLNILRKGLYYKCSIVELKIEPLVHQMFLAL